MPRTPVRHFTAGLVGLVTLWPALSHAEGSAESKAAARELAVEGIQLAQSGDCASALPKLERAESLYHAPTILGWIGECQIKNGQLVEGTENLNRVVHEQLAEGSPPAFREAQLKAKKLREDTLPKIARLTLEVTPQNLDGLEVRVDGKLVPAALLGAARPTDPGEHQVTATAPGYLAFEATVTLGEGGRESLPIALSVDPNAPTPASTSGDDPATESVSTQPETGGNTLKTVGWIGVGVGAALLAGGGVMGGMAIGEKGKLSCNEQGTCPASDADTFDSANTFATTSTILFAAGGAVLTTGVVLLIVSGGKSGKEEAKAPLAADLGVARVEPVVGIGHLGLRGTF